MNKYAARSHFLVMLVACDWTSEKDRERQVRAMRKLTAEPARWG
jgi:hypothetical protein